MTNELTDVRCSCGDEYPADSYDAGFIAGSGMCQNCDAALPPKDICTCPSGDGSLRHPCPAHPAVEQAGGDERVVDGKPRATKCPDCGEGDLMPGDLCACGYETDPAAGYACSECDGSGDGYVGEVCRECDGSGWFVTPEQARAALAQPSDEVVVTKNESGAIVSVTRQDKEGRVLSVIAESQPSPAQAEQAEAERPEVVAWSAERYVAGDHYSKPRLSFEQPYSTDRNVEALMTVAQHDRIVGELRADRDSWAEQAEQRLADWDEMRKERDAALAEVAGLRSLLNSLLCYVERDINRMRSDRDKSDNKEIYDRSISLAMERLKAAQNAVFTTEPGCDTAVELAAQTTQAQHSVPEEFSFEYRHPNGESHTVTVSRDQVINEMPDFLFEALCSKLCNCEPAGETNVVECCCDEYAEEFKLLAAAPGKEGV